MHIQDTGNHFLIKVSVLVNLVVDAQHCDSLFRTTGEGTAKELILGNITGHMEPRYIFMLQTHATLGDII